ncbi:MAG: hypothetical protein EBV03_05725 [Proteobacteria bacterium]|nr:hypothetical protein [Pseudomonadota bacterium]
MWYPLLMLVIVAGGVFVGRREKQKEWHGSPRTSPTDLPYLWEHERSKKNKPVASRIGITAPMPAQFRLERERLTHRLTKWLGFCREFQAGNTEFDDRVYILTDQKFAHRMLQNNRALQADIVAAFGQGVWAIYTSAGILVAELEESPVHPPQHKIDTILKALHGLKAAAAAASPAPRLLPGGTLLRAYFSQLPAILFSGFVVTLAAVQLLAYQLVQWPPLWPLLKESLLLFALGHLLVLRAAFGRSAHGHHAFMQFVLAGIPLGALYLFFLLWFVNCHYDRSAAQMHDEQVAAMNTSRSSKGSKRYVLRVPDWTGQSEYLSLNVSQLLYNRVKPGDVVRIHSHPGLLGMGWVARVEGK